jgi:hypothetical protein
VAKNLILEARQRVIDAYNAGDMEAAKMAAADYRARRASLARSMKNIERDREREGPGGTVLEGIGGGMLNVGRRTARLLLPESMEGNLDEKIEEQEQLDARGSGRFQGGKFLGEMVATAPVGGAAGAATKALTRLPAALRASGAVGGGGIRRGLSYAAEGAVGGHVVDDAAGEGGLAGAVLSPLLNRAGRLVRAAGTGMRRSKEAQTLLDYGADLTPGQLNPEGILGRLERTSEYSPLMGNRVKLAREQSTSDVVPNLVADQLERPRVSGLSSERVARRADSRFGTLYGPANSIKIKPPRQADLKDFRQVLGNAIRKHGPPDIDEVNRELAATWSRLARAKTTGEVKTILSDLKNESRRLKYNKESKGVGRFQTAHVYDEAAQWLDNYYKRPMTAKQAAGVSKADKMVAQYKPVEAAIVAAQATGRTQPTGRHLLRSLKNSMTKPEFSKGGGGRTRELADALAAHEKSRGGGLIERSELLRAALGAAIVPISLAGSMRIVRRAAQGQTVPQKQLKKALDAIMRHRAAQLGRDATLGLRPGVAPAMISQDEGQE